LVGREFQLADAVGPDAVEAVLQVELPDIHLGDVDHQLGGGILLADGGGLDALTHEGVGQVTQRRALHVGNLRRGRVVEGLRANSTCGVFGFRRCPCSTSQARQQHLSNSDRAGARWERAWNSGARNAKSPGFSNGRAEFRQIKSTSSPSRSEEQGRYTSPNRLTWSFANSPPGS